MKAALVRHLFNTCRRAFAFRLGLAFLMGSTPGASLQALDLFVSSPGFNSVLRYDGGTGTFLGAFASGGGLHFPSDLVFGPDGNLYVTNGVLGNNEGGVMRYDGRTGAPLPSVGNSGAFFAAPDSGGLNGPEGLTFGPDGNLYVTSVMISDGVFPTGAVLRFNGTTGAFIDAFVPFSSDLGFPSDIVFGPDGNLYVSDTGFGGGGNVLRYGGATGQFMGAFAIGGPLSEAEGIVFGPDGNLYVSNRGGDSVLRYNGTTGAFLDVFIQPHSGGLEAPQALLFGPDNELYVSSMGGPQGVLRYDGTTGAFIDTFASGASSPTGIVFGPTLIPEASSCLLVMIALAALFGVYKRDPRFSGAIDREQVVRTYASASRRI
jgi:DNA-binding beta-propeller fold protein YncE